MGSHEGKELADALDVGIGGVGVEDFAVADDIVGHDEGAGAAELEGQLQVRGQAFLIGIEKDEVEGLSAAVDQTAEAVERRAGANVHAIADPGEAEVVAGDLGIAGLELEGDELAAGGECAGHPDGGISAQGADLQHAARAGDVYEQRKKLAEAGGHIDGGKAGCAVCLERGDQRGVGRREERIQICVDLSPESVHGNRVADKRAPRLHGRWHFAGERADAGRLRGGDDLHWTSITQRIGQWFTGSRLFHISPGSDSAIARIHASTCWTHRPAGAGEFMTTRKYDLLKALLLFLIFSLLFTSFWVFRSFGIVPLSQAATLLYLDFSAGAAPSGLAGPFLVWGILLPAGCTGVLCAAARWERRGRRGAALGLVCGLVLAMGVFALQADFRLFSAAPATGRFARNIFDAYETPAIPELAHKPLNVIWIFDESLEKDYVDVAINEELESATGFMTDLTVSPLINRYTVGGVISAKCGAPMFFDMWLAMRFRNTGFNHATCFDDVLRAHGYASYFVVGHDASLSGFRNYYQRHAGAEIDDQKVLSARHVPTGNAYHTYSDQAVFDTALDILRSNRLKQPFALNILTFDNHAPQGFPSDACKAAYGTSMADVIRCDNHALAQFIVALQRGGILNNTVLVVMGDHPFMGRFHELGDRKIFAKIYTPLAGKVVLNANPSPFDFFPSVLSAMGFAVGKERYGFGYSIYDVPAYPVKDWKDWLGTFERSKATARYRAVAE